MKIFCIIGKSGSGKDSIFKKLSSDLNIFNLEKIITWTTRPMRDGEIDGIEYHFTSEEEFNKISYNDRIGKSKDIIECRYYKVQDGSNWIYFTKSEDIDPNKNYIVIATLQTLDSYRKYFGEENVIPIYIEVGDGLRLARSLNREVIQQNPNYSEMCRRYLADEADFSEDNIKQRNIEKRFYNDRLDKCVNEILDYISNFL